MVTLLLREYVWHGIRGTWKDLSIAEAVREHKNWHQRQDLKFTRKDSNIQHPEVHFTLIKPVYYSKLSECPTKFITAMHIQERVCWCVKHEPLSRIHGSHWPHCDNFRNKLDRHSISRAILQRATKQYYHRTKLVIAMIKELSNGRSSAVFLEGHRGTQQLLN